MTRLIFPLILGFGGLAVLLSLAVWQLQRLEWKQGVITEIEARIGDTPLPLSQVSLTEENEYVPVQVQGKLTGNRLRVLTSIKDVGPGFRIIETLETADGPVIMLDRGFVRDGAQGEIISADGDFVGNLLWPDEVDSWTPAPDGDLWFARDVVPMAQALGTDPVMVVVRHSDVDDPVIRPLPIDTSVIPNDHLNYAITWFLLAAVWAAMSALFGWRAWRGPQRDAV